MSFTVNGIDVDEVEHADGVSFTWVTLIGIDKQRFKHEIKWLSDGHVVTRFKVEPGGWSSYRDMDEKRWADIPDREAARDEVKHFVATTP